jgi:hypothetical protein
MARIDNLELLFRRPADILEENVSETYALWRDEIGSFLAPDDMLLKTPWRMNRVCAFAPSLF